MRYLGIVNGVRQWLRAIAVSAGSVDADKLVRLGSDGRLDSSVLRSRITILSRSATGNIVPADNEHYGNIIIEATGTITLTMSGTFPSGWFIQAINVGSTNVTIVAGTRTHILPPVTAGKVSYPMMVAIFNGTEWRTSGAEA